MTAPLLGLLLVLGFFGLEALGERLVPRLSRGPLVLYGLALALFGMEIARYDRGHADWSLWICFVGAPVLVIFGGAAAGARRGYGWPDLGPTPGRLAAVAGALLVGVLLGAQVHASDVEASEARGLEVRAALRAYEAAHGAPAKSVEDALPAAPRTRMGWFSPPPYAWDPATRTLSFPVGGGFARALDAAADVPAWRRVERTERPGRVGP